MGKVVVTLKLTNFRDLILKQAKARKAQPRQAQVEALVDTGATRLYLKPSVIEKLGLEPTRKILSRTTNGSVERHEYGEVSLELLGRSGTFQVVEVPEDVPNLVGQVPLEVLDFVVDPKGQKLIGNPDHGGVQMTEEY